MPRSARLLPSANTAGAKSFYFRKPIISAATLPHPHSKTQTNPPSQYPCPMLLDCCPSVDLMESRIRVKPLINKKLNKPKKPPKKKRKKKKKIIVDRAPANNKKKKQDTWTSAALKWALKENGLCDQADESCSSEMASVLSYAENLLHQKKRDEEARHNHSEQAAAEEARKREEDAKRLLEKRVAEEEEAEKARAEKLEEAKLKKIFLFIFDQFNY